MEETMSPLRKIMAAAAMVLTAVSVASPSASADTSRAATTARYQYRAYHGLDEWGFISSVPKSGSGLRPVVITNGQQKSQERYAMFWDNRPGPDWKLGGGSSGSGTYQQEFDRLTAQGYQPTMVTATGSGSSASFIAIWEKKPGKFYARHGLSIPEFQLANNSFNANGYMPISVNLYGTPSDPRVVAVWAARPSGVFAHVTVSSSAAEYQSDFEYNVKRGFRSSAIAVSPDGKGYLAVWRNDSIGAWYSFHAMSAAQYQARFDEMTAKGLYPIWIDMENGVYAAVFTAR
ncbi:hypothetical protein [Microtetraspora malaysiensis]|uniref:hypothetical protein n=1 Tax=Microtetraspora malaysiensis TaxID=161358 RepID=UPI0012F79C4E|nr:hypothetical protein [Microtetraspora malaysiensis]